MAMPAASAAAITSSSRTEPPGWMQAVAPASIADCKPSAKGNIASDATMLPLRSSPASFAFQIAMREESTRLICPAPMPRVRSLLA